MAGICRPQRGVTVGRTRTIERDKLLDAAEAVTLEKGPAGLTIAAVAEQMGITNGGVQYSFRSKESLIAAMFERWQEEYAERIAELGASDPTGPCAVRKHIDYAADYADRSRRGAPSLLVTLLNSPQHMTLVRKWYRDRVDMIDVDGERGRRLRLAFLAMEGAFLMRLFGLMEMGDAEWQSIVADVVALADGEPEQDGAKVGRAAA